MAEQRNKDSGEPKRGYSSFKEDREAHGNARHGAHTVEDSRSDHSMDPQPVNLPAGTGSGLGKAVGAAAGAVIGGAAGIIGGPVGVAAGAAAGAVVGGSAGGTSGHWADKQDDEDLEDKRAKDGPARDA